jgi:hypothetical protein
MIVETFFLMEEKRSIRTPNFHQEKTFQDLSASRLCRTGPLVRIGHAELAGTTGGQSWRVASAAAPRPASARIGQPAAQSAFSRSCGVSGGRRAGTVMF